MLRIVRLSKDKGDWLLFAGRHDTAGTTTKGDAYEFLIGPEGSGGLI